MNTDNRVEFNPWRMKRVIEAQLSGLLVEFQGQVMTESMLKLLNTRVVEFLKHLQDGEDIPADVNINYTHVVTRANDPSAANIQLPVLLRLYMQYGIESVRTARFRHDSVCCHFLGHGLGSDLYHCKQHGLPTVLARHSSIPSDYESGMAAAELMSVVEPLGLALILSKEAGLVLEL